MRITIVQGAFLPVPPLLGGALENIFLHLGREFASRGHEVIHICRAFPGLRNEEYAHGVTYRRVPGFDAPASILWHKVCDLRYCHRVRKILQPADVIISHTFWLPILSRDRRYGQIYACVHRHPKGQLALYSRHARILTVSQSVVETIRRQARNWIERTDVVGNPIEPDALARDPAIDRSRFAAPRQLLYAGRLHPEKGIHLVLEALSVLAGELPPGIRLKIVGPHEVRAGGGGEAYLKRLQDLASTIPLPVEFTGGEYDRDRLLDHYRQASLFLYPSLATRGETFGLAPLEAMSQGCPALVSGLSCFREFIDQDRNGFVVDLDGAQPSRILARALRPILQGDVDLTAVAARARETAEEFSLERIASAYLEVFSRDAARDGTAG